MSEPVLVVVKRWKCPTCPRTHSSKSRAREHMARCWWSPVAKACLTCVHYTPGDNADFATGYPGSPEQCFKGVSLAGRPECASCLGECAAWIGDEPNAQRVACPDCGGNGKRVKPGPIVHCSLWEPSSEYSSTFPRS
jgi:hypothetical protein